MTNPAREEIEQIKREQDAGIYTEAWADEPPVSPDFSKQKAHYDEQAVLAGLLRDARRYRKLRNIANRTLLKNKHYPGIIQVIQWIDRTEANVLFSDSLDAAIDAAIAQERK